MKRRMVRHLLVCGLVTAAGLLAREGVAAASSHTLIDPATVLTTGHRVDFTGSTDFSVVTTGVGPCLAIVPHRSAAGIYQSVNLGARDLAAVHWSWKVDRLQRSADLRSLATEDSGATIFFVFGEPSMFDHDVPTLAYVWSSTPVPDGTGFASARYSHLYYVQLRGQAEVGSWQTETLDVAADYRRVFGREPGPLKYIAVLADNDQTGEPASALIGAIANDR